MKFQNFNFYLESGLFDSIILTLYLIVCDFLSYIWLLISKFYVYFKISTIVTLFFLFIPQIWTFCHKFDSEFKNFNQYLKILAFHPIILTFLSQYFVFFPLQSCIYLRVSLIWTEKKKFSIKSSSYLYDWHKCSSMPLPMPAVCHFWVGDK